MITRLYVNNYRCLVAFEMRLDPLRSMSVLCGANGAGKSSVFDALKFVRDLATGNCFLGIKRERNVVTQLEFTSWLDSTIQEFEIELDADGQHFLYVLHIEQVAPYEQPRIRKEIVRCDNRMVYERDLQGVTFENGHGFPLDWRQAALASIQSTSGRREIGALQKAFENMVILRPNVHAFEQESQEESRSPAADLSNLTSWYRHLAQDQEWTDLLRDSLRGVWPDDFKSLKLTDAGISAKWLELRFEGIAPLRFDLLSDGEKMLVALYMIHAALSIESTGVRVVLIDEPDNFVSLQELQPWLLAVAGLMDSTHQAVLISHSTEILNSNPSGSFYFWRDNHKSPTRIGPLNAPEGMLPAEALTLGWDNTTREAV
ncbi:MAG: AAA family ATPase [Treponematales bacterium]